MAEPLGPVTPSAAGVVEEVAFRFQSEWKPEYEKVVLTTLAVNRHWDPVAEEPLYALCYVQVPGTFLACDRPRLHQGLHSWDNPKYGEDDGG